MQHGRFVEQGQPDVSWSHSRRIPVINPAVAGRQFRPAGQKPLNAHSNEALNECAIGRITRHVEPSHLLKGNEISAPGRDDGARNALRARRILLRPADTNSFSR